jgi:2-amino-4-hydroxy-6-hydroxymethyldihydropteridine diphosphokinase
MKSLILLLGSNLGNRAENLATALSEIEKNIGELKNKSSVHETESWGYQSENSFLNLAVEITTELDPVTVLKKNHEIERSLGRTRIETHQPVRQEMYTDRTIDIDIIFYADLVLKTDELVIPHPHMHERLFVLEPLCEICPEKSHPVLHKTVLQLRDLLRDKKIS